MKTNNPEIVFTHSPLPSLHRAINIPLCSRALTQPVINVSSAANLLPCKLILQGAETSRDVGVCAQNALPAPRPCTPSSAPRQKGHPKTIQATPLRSQHHSFAFQVYSVCICRTGWWSKGTLCASSRFSSRMIIWKGTASALLLHRDHLGSIAAAASCQLGACGCSAGGRGPTQ